jgi:hypothetical protein
MQRRTASGERLQDGDFRQLQGAALTHMRGERRLNDEAEENRMHMAGFEEKKMTRPCHQMRSKGC